MTYYEAEASDRDMLTPADVAEILGVHPQTISDKAKEGSLEFAAFRSGNTTKIPRLAFLHWLKYGNAPVEVKG
jgi:excisionase family DNA binding protein